MNKYSLKRFKTYNKTKLPDDVYKFTSVSKQVGKFNEITHYIQTYVQQTYVYGGDIQKALDDNREFDFSAIMPKRIRSTN